MGVEAQLAEIVGAENVLHEPEQLKPYSSALSLEPPRMPGYVVRPSSEGFYPSSSRPLSMPTMLMSLALSGNTILVFFSREAWVTSSSFRD